MWVLDHLDDLDADFRVHYRIEGVGEEEFGSMTGPRFFALASRVVAYGGAMAHYAARQFAGDEPVTRPSGRDVEQVDSSGAALLSHPVLSGLIDYN